MFDNTLAPKTKLLAERLNGLLWMKKFYLAGGTGLALHYGHRQSVDLDWFSPHRLNVPQLLKQISTVAPCEVLNQEKDTLEGIVASVKMSFITYPYPLIAPPARYNKLAIAAPLDIAIMKLGAIADRNTKKDFIDLYIFLEREYLRLDDLITAAERKFAPARYDRYHLYKSLTYFTEADAEAMPKMFISLEWKKVKKFFVDEVKKLMKN